MNKWDIVSTTYEDTFYFKIKTTWTNSMTHLSASVTFTVTCNNNYGLSTSGTVTAYQVYTHGSSSVGFILPTYQSSQNLGCPIEQRLLSTADNGVGVNPTTPSNLV